MTALIVIILILVVAVFLIWKSSDWMTDSMVPVAKKLGTSYIAVTSLIISLILSMPEIFSSVYSLLLGHMDCSWAMKKKFRNHCTLFSVHVFLIAIMHVLVL